MASTPGLANREVFRPPIDPVIETYKRDLDRTLLRSAARWSVEQRLQELMRLERFAEEMRRAGRRAFRDPI